MLAAVEAPSRMRVPPSSSRFVVRPVMIDRGRPEGRADEHDPVVAEAVRQQAEQR